MINLPLMDKKQQGELHKEALPHLGYTYNTYNQ